MDVVARAMAFVIVLIAANVEQVKLVNQTELLEHIQRAINGDAMNVRIDFLRALKDRSSIQMLLGVIHHFEEHAALASDANTALGERGLQAAGPGMGV